MEFYRMLDYILDGLFGIRIKRFEVEEFEKFFEIKKIKRRHSI